MEDKRGVISFYEKNMGLNETKLSIKSVKSFKIESEIKTKLRSFTFSLCSLSLPPNRSLQHTWLEKLWFHLPRTLEKN